MEESFVRENYVLPLHLSIENSIFVPFAVQNFDSIVLVFRFLNIVKCFRKEINAYSESLQNERHVLKQVSS